MPRMQVRLYANMAKTLLRTTGAGWILTGAALAQAFPGMVGGLDQLSSVPRRPLTPSYSSLTMTAVPDDFAKIRLAPGFLVQLDIYGVPEFSQALRIDGQGNLNIPFLGPVGVMGQTASEAQVTIRSALVASQILNDPQITLNILQYVSGSATVLGQIQSPGRISLLAPKNLEEVLALVGGEMIDAGNLIEIHHPGQPTVLVHYTQGGSVEPLRQTLVQPGDSVYVRRAGVIYVLGGVNRPGGYLMVNGGQLNALQAVSLAWGTTLASSTGKVYVLRGGDDRTQQKIEISLKKMQLGKVPPFALQVNDILFIPTSTTKEVLINGGPLLGGAVSAAIYRAP